MNELYVSENCLPEHLKRRRSFEKNMLFVSVIAGIIVVAILLSLVLSGKFNLWAIVSAIILGGLVLMLPLFKYVPAVESTLPQLVGTRTSQAVIQPSPPKKTVRKKPKKTKKKKR